MSSQSNTEIGPLFRNKGVYSEVIPHSGINLETGTDACLSVKMWEQSVDDSLQSSKIVATQSMERNDSDHGINDIWNSEAPGEFQNEGKTRN
jgi:hypothetical protein